MIRIKLPKPNYKPMVWSKSELKFVNTNFDILENQNFLNLQNEPEKILKDYELFIKYDLQPGEIGFVKILKDQKV